jgi:intraflagellar transport protein 81
MNEMKAYIGADEMIELVQKSRGFKSYRDLYTKKISEAENASKVLKIEQKEVKASYFAISLIFTVEA